MEPTYDGELETFVLYPGVDPLAHHGLRAYAAALRGAGQLAQADAIDRGIRSIEVGGRFYEPESVEFPDRAANEHEGGPIQRDETVRTGVHAFAGRSVPTRENRNEPHLPAGAADQHPASSVHPPVGVTEGDTGGERGGGVPQTDRRTETEPRPEVPTVRDGGPEVRVGESQRGREQDERRDRIRQGSETDSGGSVGTTEKRQPEFGAEHSVSHDSDEPKQPKRKQGGGSV